MVSWIALHGWTESSAITSGMGGQTEALAPSGNGTLDVRNPILFLCNKLNGSRPAISAHGRQPLHQGHGYPGPMAYPPLELSFWILTCVMGGSLFFSGKVLHVA